MLAVVHLKHAMHWPQGDSKHITMQPLESLREFLNPVHAHTATATSCLIDVDGELLLPEWVSSISGLSLNGGRKKMRCVLLK
jgi:hypothetical protein